jgi:Nucleotidyltransferase domain.
MNREVLTTLLYFDLFKHPLTANEIHQFNRSSVEPTDIERILLNLQEEKLIYKISQFYTLSQEPATVERRLAANERAKQKMVEALRFSEIIANFPFVKAILLSGSISKGVMHADSDIDYFVVTQNKKVWVVKFLLVLYRKIFLFNERKHFCANYIIDEQHMEIAEKNRFTATEVVTLIPTFGYQLYLKFAKQNQWAYEYFPNCPKRTDANIIRTPKKTWSFRIITRIFNGSFGQWFGTQFMNYSWKRYQNKFKDQLDEQWMKIAFKSTPNVSKSHGPNFQKVVQDRLKIKIHEFGMKNNINIKQDVFNIDC